MQTQLRSHVALEHELSGNEQQVMTVICGLKCVAKVQVSKMSIMIIWYCEPNYYCLSQKAWESLGIFLSFPGFLDIQGLMAVTK